MESHSTLNKNRLPNYKRGLLSDLFYLYRLYNVGHIVCATSLPAGVSDIFCAMSLYADHYTCLLVGSDSLK
ncbi:unnamed protein product [Prunus brigantina]